MLNDLDKQRRDLYAISLSIIVYICAGGSIRAESSLFFGSVTVTRPWVLLYSAPILWIYFLWRFELARKGVHSAFRDDVESEIRKSKRFADFTGRRLGVVLEEIDKEIARLKTSGERNANLSWESLQMQSAVLRERIATRGCFALNSNSDAPCFQKFNERMVEWETRGGVMTSFDHIDKRYWTEAERRVPWSDKLRNSIVRSATWRAWRKRNTFSDEYLPLLVAGIAALSMLVRFGQLLIAP